MKSTPDSFASSVSRSLPSICVIAGDEALLVSECLDALRLAARKAGVDERVVLEVDRSFDWSLLDEACRSMSLFGSRKLVELRMESATPSAQGAALLKSLCESPSPDVIVAVVCGSLDARQRKAAWFEAIESAGVSVYAWPIGPMEFPEWLETRLRKAGLTADREALQLLADRTEGNLLAASQDVAKLALLFPDGQLNAERVREAVADSARFDAFDLGSRILGGDAAGVVRSLARLREEGLEVLEVLGPLSYNLRTWAQAQAIYMESRDAQQACQVARVPRPAQPAMKRALARTRPVQILGWIRQCASIDQLAKSTLGREQAWEELLTLSLAAAGVDSRGLKA